MYLKEDYTAVVYKINFYETKGLFEMTEGYSSYPLESEVLLQDGLEYTITAIDKI